MKRCLLDRFPLEEPYVSWVDRLAHQSGLRRCSVILIVLVHLLVTEEEIHPRMAKKLLKRACTRYGRRRVSAVIGRPVRELERAVRSRIRHQWGAA